MLKNKKLISIIYFVGYTLAIIYLSTFLLIYLYFHGFFKYISLQKYINSKIINIEENISNTNYIPNNYNGNIFIVLDNFSDLEFEFDGVYGRTYLHGEKVLEEFNKVKNDKDKVILLNRTSTHIIDSEFKKILLNNQKIVSFVKDTKYYYYEEILDKIIKNNPNANIIVNQSFYGYEYFISNVDLLNKYNNLHIIQAMPYRGNNMHQNFIEYYSIISNYNHNRLLYVTKCGDYQPSFSKNIKCSDEDTSFSSPKLGYQYFKE